MGLEVSASNATRRRIRAVAPRVRVLVLDEEQSIRGMLEDFLGSHLPGVTIRCVASADEARAQLQDSHFDIFLTDLGVPDVEGRDLVAESAECYREMTVIVITGKADIEDAVSILRRGAYDFIVKPIDFAQLGVAIDRAVDRWLLRNENKQLKLDRATRTQLPNMIGASLQMGELVRNVRLIASRNNSVLVVGESGTGKELVARAIHNLSPRAKGPFVPVNVAAIPETLMEAEFFGYGKNSGVSGAPPGGRAGMFEAASGGTLFLDEIGDMPVGAQAKVLRALQEREVVRIGTTRPVPIDIRVVCATHQDLEQAVREKSFRDDLYFRLNGFPIRLPPLRERPDDIPVLAQHFLDAFSADEPAGTQQKVFAPDAIEVLQSMPWPGNVRELKSRVERLAITCNGDVIRAAHIEYADGRRDQPSNAAAPVPMQPQPPVAEVTDHESATREFEHGYLLRLLSSAEWNVTRAAERAKLSRTYIHRLMKKHGISRPS